MRSSRQTFTQWVINKYNMQISTIATTNPNLVVGLWVENVYYPEAGAGQVQSFVPTENAYFIEHFQKPVVNHESLNGVLHKQSQLVLAQYLYMGHYQHTLYYAHNTEAFKMEFQANEEIRAATDFDEASTCFTFRKAYLKTYHSKHGMPLTLEDQEFILDYWQSTGGALADIIPYLIQGMRLAETSNVNTVHQMIAA